MSRSPASMATQRGVYGLMLALLLIPLIAVVGFAVDFARMVQYKSDLQNAVDEAALAGAAVFTNNTAANAAAAVAVATEYFNRALLPTSLSVTAPTVTSNGSGTLNPALSTNAALTVTVSATAKVANTLFSVLVPSETINATGTAADPVVTPQLVFSNVNAQACDGNTAYLYQVPTNANGSGYNYASVPSFSTSNYYWIGSSMGSSTAPKGQSLPIFSANQPLGVALLNTTNGNTGNSSCGANVTGANSYGAPNGGSQMFYSSLLLNGQSPSENSNSTYPVSIVTTSTTTHQSTSTVITSVTLTPPAAPGATSSPQTYSGSTLAPSPYNIQATYTGGANCVVNSTSNSTRTSGSTTTVTTTTNYSCTTQYRQQASNSGSYAPNCSLYVQTGVSSSYINGLSNSSPAPAASLGQCSTTAGGGANYAAPSCAQLSELQNSGSAPAAVFWWDDAGGVGPGEQYYSPSGHCSQIASGSAGYGEDCQYKNNFFATQCTISGGAASGFTEVVLTQ